MYTSLRKEISHCLKENITSIQQQQQQQLLEHKNESNNKIQSDFIKGKW